MVNDRRVAVRACALVRGEGVGYVAFRSDDAHEGLRARAQLRSGDEVPCELFVVRSTSELEVLAAGARHAWVVVVPLLSGEIVISLECDGGEVGRTTFPAMRSKVSSRLLSMSNPQAAAVLRGFEQRHGTGRTAVRIDEAWLADDNMVAWRVHVSYPTGDATATPDIAAYGEDGSNLLAHAVCMEDQVVADQCDPTRLERVVTFSCLLPQGVRAFHVRTWLGKHRTHEGFAGMNAPRAEGMVAWAHRAACGDAGTTPYDVWFEDHRASFAELQRQREAFRALPVDERMLVSIVMPVFRTSGPFLQAAIDSVLAQSYEAWELLVINASGPCAEVDGVLGGIHDKRVRVIATKNRSIAENTNEGIAQVEGDYVAFMNHDDVLEGDALWHVVQAVRSQPDVDLLYTDEDHLQGSRVHAPKFKMGPNYGKLYAHNYVKHLLVVSRHVLELTERSGADVAGAQDYDLTLKAFEHAREIVHIPRVLYHQREHEGSTSDGSSQKPFAHQAGRRALAAHLKRRNIAAQVDDGPLPYTYRVRYRLPQDEPKVSIVIPTRDHADLLSACVTSILERSTYHNYEIVLVENNSEQDETFACYDELRAKDPRVRVIRWRPPVAGMFNYSAIVNHGVRHVTGEYLVLLNNDTEVIEPAWIEEMLGCLMRPEVGIVGAKLLFEDGLTQHVFVSANPNGDFMHVCQNLTRDALGPAYAAVMPGDCSMVTGACQMMRRSLFDLLGGYDEQLAVGFNDGDFCLRAIEEDYVITVAPYAVLRHREFSSRGRETTDSRMRMRYVAEKAYVMGRHPEFFGEGDFALNPNLDRFSPYLSL